MLVISIIVIAFGVVGMGLSLYLRFTVVSPILAKSGEKVEIGALSLQQILNLIFVYFTFLHIIIILIGVNFLLESI